MIGESPVVTAVRRRAGRALRESGVDLSAGVLVVAVSGGPDSLAMLDSLCHLREELSLRLHVAHLDHGLRRHGPEDARFVSGVAEELGLPATVERRPVERKGSREGAAREARYRFLEEVARRERAVAVAVGHTADDQAETVLLHLARGSGLRGLRGMLPVAPWPLPTAPPASAGAAGEVPRSGEPAPAAGASHGARPGEPDRGYAVAGEPGLPVVLRPLLGVWRAETEAYCREAGLRPRRDATNRSPRARRNLVRHRVLPALARVNPGVKEALVGLASAAAEEARFLDREVEGWWGRVAERAGRGVLLERGAVRALQPALQAGLVRRGYAEVRGTSAGLERAHLEQALDVLSGPAGRSCSLPGRLALSAGFGRAYLGPAGTEPRPPALEGCGRLPVPGELELPGWRLGARPVSSPGRGPAGGSAPRAGRGPASGWRVELDRGAVGEELWVRGWRPGDRIQPAGMQGTRKLQDLFVDAGVPRPWRRATPVVVSRRGVVWVVGLRVAGWALASRGPGTLALEAERVPVEAPGVVV